MVSQIQKELPEDIFNLSDWYLGGGCIYSIWNDKDPKDYDIFCKSKKAANKLKRYFKKNKEQCDVVTSNAVSKGKWQFVIRNVGEPEVEVNKFDFKHNMNYYDNGRLHTCAGWEYLDSNNLEFNSDRGRDILNIMTRIPKFVERGMEITQMEMLDILEKGTRPTKIFKERKTIKRRRSGKSHY